MQKHAYGSLKKATAICVMFSALLFLQSCGMKSSPPQTLEKATVVRMAVPPVLLQQYPDPPEPRKRTVGALLEYILAQREINRKHNADKEAINLLQNAPDLDENTSIGKHKGN